MRLSSLNRQWLYDLATETFFRLTAATKRTQRLTWNLPADVQRVVAVRWPSRYEWAPGAKWGDQILDALARWVPVRREEIAQPYRGTVQCHFIVHDKSFPVAFNTSDYPDFLEPASVAETLVTFKAQFDARGYGDDRIVAGGYLPSSTRLYSLLDHLRNLGAREPLYDVYGRFGLDATVGIRGEVLGELNRQTLFRYFGGDSLVRYSRYLQQAARSKVCVDLPGRGPLCFRFVEYLAMGSCIVGWRQGIKFPGPLSDGVQHVAVDDTPTMIQQCAELLANGQRRRSLGDAARQYFDTYLHRDQLGAYYIHVVLARCGVTSQ